MKTDAEVCVCKHDSLLTTSFSIIYTNCTVSDNNFLHNVLSINVKVSFKVFWELPCIEYTYAHYRSLQMDWF